MRLRPANTTHDLYLQLERLFSGGLDLGNMKGELLTFETTGGVQEVKHHLGYVPQWFDLKRREGKVSVWAERVADWDRFKVYVGSDAAGVRVHIHLQ